MSSIKGLTVRAVSTLEGALDLIREVRAHLAAQVADLDIRLNVAGEAVRVELDVLKARCDSLEAKVAAAAERGRK